MTKHYIGAHAAESVTEFALYLDPLNPIWGDEPSQWAFRGQANAGWGLVPSILRDQAFGRYLMPHERRFAEASPFFVVSAEFKAVQEFWMAADRAGLSVPEDSQIVRSQERLTTFMASADPIAPLWPPLELLSIIALAQHHGVPTRLLDWSWKPLVAAYFAAQTSNEDESATHLAVWAIHTSQITSPPADPVGNLPRLQVVTAPQASNRNLSAQAGLFTLDREHYAPPLDEVLVNLEVEGDSPVCILRKITLPRTERGALLRWLGLHGVTAASIFPSYDGVVRSIEERWSWDPLPRDLRSRLIPPFDEGD